MISRDFYLKNIYPKVDLPLNQKYENVSLVSQNNFGSIIGQSVVMLVALTGTGKTTTIDELSRLMGRGIETNAMPSRREIADWIAIPTAQFILNEPIQPIDDRVKRFHYTRIFAQHVEGGMAAAFSWLNISKDYHNRILSEGIRGANEIRFALQQCPRWHIIELVLNPITRLERLSARNDQFDIAEGSPDVTYLPDSMQSSAYALFDSGTITAQALMIMRAEAENYGLGAYPQGDQFANYHQVDVNDLTPTQVAHQIVSIIEAIAHA